jgi:copper(I)-binding protein
VLNPALALRHSTRRAFLLLAAGAAALAAAGSHEPGKLSISHPWSRPTAAGMSMGVAYLTITNHGKSADTLIAASSPAAARVEMHQTTLVDGMARMRPLREIPIAPGATVKIEPAGIHLMLVDLVAPLVAGQSVPLTLEFRAAGRISVQLAVESPR